MPLRRLLLFSRLSFAVLHCESSLSFFLKAQTIKAPFGRISSFSFPFLDMLAEEITRFGKALTPRFVTDLRNSLAAKGITTVQSERVLVVSALCARCFTLSV